MAVEFKVLLKHLRLRANYGLRRFAELVSESPSNYAGVESGQRAPWRSPEKLRKVAEALALREGSEDWDAFFTAAKGYVGLPPDVEEILEQPYIPALLRKAKDLTADELRRLVEEGFFERAVDSLRKKPKGRPK